MVATRRKPAAASISSTSSLSPLPFSASTRDFSVSRTLTTNTTRCQGLFSLLLTSMWLTTYHVHVGLLLKIQRECKIQNVPYKISYHSETKVDFVAIYTRRCRTSALRCVWSLPAVIKMCNKSLNRISEGVFCGTKCQVWCVITEMFAYACFCDWTSVQVVSHSPPF